METETLLDKEELTNIKDFDGGEDEDLTDELEPWHTEA